MNRGSSPGLGQWLTVSLMVALSIFLLVKLYQYAGFRQYYPAGLTIAGVDVGGMTRDEASELLNNRYIDAPVAIYHRENVFDINPAQANFTLDRETMLSEADFQRVQQDFWAGFWGFLWGRPIEVEPVPLAATHDREALREVLQNIANLNDTPAQPPQPVPSTLSFQFGEPGTQTNIQSSFNDVEAALYRPVSREAHLIIEPQTPSRPEINLLTRLLVNKLQDFEQATGGAASVFILELATGEERTVNAATAMSGMDLLKLPLALEIYRTLDRPPTLSQRQLISDTLVVRPDHISANALLNIVAGQADPYLGAELVTQSMRQLGLVNTFMTTPYDDDEPRQTVETPANSVEEPLTRPTPHMQTTAEDMGTLLSMIYYCAQGQGGAISAVYDDAVTQAECQALLTTMQANQIGSLIEEGAPEGTAVSHRHGWISDTHGDAGILFTPGGDYVLVVLLYKPDWLEWEISSPLIADISRAVYNYFNFDAPYLAN
ncbi:MAG: serine hydrolase [Chloroflexi bacterium]|nr:serine hydrolase [Chloroflexota bacterium]